MSHLFNRLLWAKQNLPSVQSSKVVVFEDPAFEHEPCKILSPSPEWMACAMYGEILPPVEAYHEMEYMIEDNFGNEYNGVTQLEFEDMLFDFASAGKAMRKQVVTKHDLHGEAIPAMTEDEAISYLLKKDTPKRVWGNTSGNWVNYRVVDRSEVLDNRKHRNYWKLSQEGDPIEVALPRLSDIEEHMMRMDPTFNPY